MGRGSGGGGPKRGTKAFNQKLIKAGGNRWTKGGKDRIYFNERSVLTSSKIYNGLSKTKQRGVLYNFQSGKTFYDVKTKKFNYTGRTNSNTLDIFNEFASNF